MLVRHGVTNWNTEGRIQGQGGEGLSADGHEQARVTAAWLEESFPDAQYYSSDLQRCRETVTPLVELAEIAVEFREELRERHFGEWTSHTHAEVEERWPDQWSAWRRGEEVAGDIGGETSAELTARVCSFVHEIVAELEEGGTVVLITHGGPIWNGVHELVGLPRGSLGGVGNASITVLHDYGHAVQLALWNQVGHLPPRLRTWFRTGRAPGQG